MVIYSIYKITNTINNKIYIGFTSNFELRKRKHLFDVINGKISHLHNAIRKHGINNFSWQIIYQSKDKEYTLNEMEKHFIVENNSHQIDGFGYNGTYGGQGTFGPKSEVTKLKLSLANQYRGKKLPKEIKDKISKKLKGRVFSKEHLARKSEAQKKKVIINGIVYDSGRDAAKEYSISPTTMVKWLKNGRAEYYKNE